MDGTTASAVVDITPLLNTLIDLLAVVALTVGTWAAHKYGTKVGIEKDSEIRKYLDEAILNGINFAATKLKAAGDNIDEIELKNQRLAEAANYVVKGVPDALKHFKIDEARLKTLIEARLS